MFYVKDSKILQKKKKNFSGAFPNIKEIFKQHFEKLTEN